MGCSGSKASAAINPENLSQDPDGKSQVTRNDINQHQLNAGPGVGKLDRTLDDINPEDVANSPKRLLSQRSINAHSKLNAGTFQLPRIFGWKNLKQQEVTILTAQFIYYYDHEKHAFKIKNDASRYTQSKLDFNFLSEYNLYNFTLRDLKLVNLEDFSEQDLEIKIDYHFDVDSDGRFLGIPDVEDIVKRALVSVGGHIERTNEYQIDGVIKLIDNQSKVLWKGLVENQIMPDNSTHAVIMKEEAEGGKDKKMELIECKRLELEDPVRIRQFIEQKFDSDKEYRKIITEKAVKKSSIKKIVGLNEKDASYRFGGPSHKDLKFVNIDKYQDFTTICLKSDMRPIQSEQMCVKNIIFAFFNKKLEVDIQIENKIVFLLWDEVKSTYTNEKIKSEIQKFKDKNLNILESIKHQLKINKVM